MKDKRNEEIFMRRAIQLALQADAISVSPNPRVGAVLVHAGRVIGEGCHRKCGECHAEVACIKSVRTEDRKFIPEATLYCTLEPCAHVGRTGSCAMMLVEQSVRRVVIGCIDPNPLVGGKGIAILRDGGVEVEVGMLREACQEVAHAFLTGQRLGRPFITLKWAQSTDGFIDRQRDAHAPATAFSSTFTRILVHRERAEHAAILVGTQTFVMDRPRLDNRYWFGSSPTPLLLDPTARLAHQVRSFSDGERWHMVTYAPAELLEGVTMQLARVSKGNELADLMKYLMLNGLNSLLVEGGAKTLGHFIEADLWDELRIETAPITLGNGVVAPKRPEKARLVDEQTFDGRMIRRYRSPESLFE